MAPDLVLARGEVIMHPAKKLLHTLWGKAKEDEETYDKKQWLELQVFINKWARRDEDERAKFAHEFEKYH
jgi:hypothetical protein